MKKMTYKLILPIAVFAVGTLQAAEYHVSMNGKDANAGSANEPLLTIQRAADLAQPGDTITVYEGVYRERVDPPRGRTSDEKRIVYQAAPGEKVTITGAEIVTGWKDLGSGLWQGDLGKEFFGSFYSC
jgi:alpha-N-arabinofuranosidase